MAFIEVMARDSQGRPFASKAAMGRELAAGVANVSFTSVQGLGPVFVGTADQIPAGTKLTVVGPDPEVRRNWYGTVELRDGQVKLDGKTPKPGTAKPAAAKVTDADKAQRRADAATLRGIVSRTMFCPYTGEILDMRRAVVVRQSTGARVMAAWKWDEVKDEFFAHIGPELAKKVTVLDGRELFTPAGRVRA